MFLHGAGLISAALTWVSFLGCGRCEGPGSEPTCTENCDAWTLLQSKLGSNERSDSLQLGGSSGSAGTAATSPEAKTAMVSFVDGDTAEIRDWIRCSITGAGEKRGTYNIRVQGAGGASKDLPNIPSAGLRKVAGGAGSYGTSPQSAFEEGEQALVVRWVPCSVSGRGAAPDTYNVVVPEWSPARVSDVPVARLRKARTGNWLYNADPTLPSKIPGQTAICRTEESCSKVLVDCVAKKSGWAAQNCGSRCDVVFVGDSILERLTGWMCFSNNPKFQDSKSVFQELIGSKHPKNLILAGSCDETAQTLYTLGNALPNLKEPKMYFVMIGTNNIPKGGSAHALHGIRAVVAKLRAAHPSAHLMMHALLPRADDKVLRFQTHVDEVNEGLEAFAAAERAAGARIEFVDCTSALHPRAQRAEDFDNLMLHPTPKGYRAWLTCIGPVIDRALASLADK